MLCPLLLYHMPGRFAGRPSLTAVGLSAVTAVALASSNLYHMLQSSEI